MIDSVHYFEVDIRLACVKQIKYLIILLTVGFICYKYKLTENIKCLFQGKIIQSEVIIPFIAFKSDCNLDRQRVCGQ